MDEQHMEQLSADEAESPWALQLAARVEKLDPPSTPAVCAVAALATIALLDDERSRPGGPWHLAVTAWNGARIRKLVRRGRASAWARAQNAEGVTVERDNAQVRAFVPSRMDDVPLEVAKLQIRSTSLEEVVQVSRLPAMPSNTLVVAVTPHFEMSWGKQAAQCAHAAQRAWMLGDREIVQSWDAAERPLVVVHPDAELWRSLTDRAEIEIHDGGYTEIPAGTNTTRAWWVDRPK